jgi:hypothetical protein
MYYGLIIPITAEKEEKENIEIYELVSKAICDMLLIIRKKIFKEDKIPLTKEDHMLIYDVKFFFIYLFLFKFFFFLHENLALKMHSFNCYSNSLYDLEYKEK